MTIESDGEERFREANHHVQDEERVGDGIVGGGPGSFGDDESRVYRIDGEGVKDGKGRMLQSQGVQQGPHQQQPQGSAVRWERFLHVPSIKVLLVENDDSTRHLVTALLRNGNYDVVEAANGLQAWKHLEDLNNHIDLILTEVVMPCLSGIGLLCKIMSHNTRKNIPVIMMSSHDSMALVFKCLSKGAVDFLVKPIRKNELRNLWQHIWRRCHSSSGSGSESGAQTQKSVKSKSSVKSDNNNNSSSNDKDDDGSDGSEDGSGTQSSWTKQAVEVDSSPPVSPWDKKSGSPDSTCALVIHSNAEISGSNWVPMTATRESQEQEEPLDNVVKGKELVKGEPRNFELQTGSPFEVRIKLAGAEQNALLELNSTPNSKRLDKGSAQFSGEYPSNKHKAVIINMPDPPLDSKTIGEPANVLEINNKSIDNSKELPDIELSLKRLRGVEDTGETVRSDRNVLRRLELSAFSRYNTTSNASRAPNCITGSSSLIENSEEIVKKESLCDLQSHPTRNLLYPTSNGVSNIIDMGSITNKLSTNPVVFKSETTSTINGLHPSSAFLPMTNDLRCPPPQVILVKSDDVASNAMLAPPSGSHQELPIQHIHHHHDVHHFHNIGRQRLLPSHDDISLNKLATGSPHCGSSNMLGGPIENNPENDILNRSASGSKHGSNNKNGSSTAVNARGRNVESDVGLAGNSGGGDASGSGSGNIIDQNKFAHREAALTKFRQKRKERCFRKKVRYQNRKRLAEQRPRVRGQFVRQTEHEGSNSNADN